MIARLVESRELAPGTRHFVFAVEGGEFRYEPGQFVSLVKKLGDDEITRAYSIASAPDLNHFALCANLVPDGRFTPFLFAMVPGDTVELKAVLGTFVLRKPAVDSILVATGTGIAPFRAMLANPPSAQVTMIFGVRTESTLLYNDEWRALAATHSTFDYRPTLTRPDSAWKGRIGRVHDHVLEALGARRDVDIYICGLRDMVDELRARLKALGVDRKRIVYERYD